jgi:hypothetical protein
MESRAIATGCRLAGATTAWLRRCTEVVVWACQDAHAGALSGQEMRKKGSTTSTWIAWLLVLGCWCYKELRHYLVAGAA